MRHFSGKPYVPNTFSGPVSFEKRWVQVIDWVERHDGCSREDILKGVWGYSNPKVKRSSNSTTFARLLYYDFIDYDKHHKYHISKNGEEILKKLYVCGELS